MAYFVDKVIISDAFTEPDNTEIMWLAEPKGEMRTNVPLKNAAAKAWCEKMSATKYGGWRSLFAQRIPMQTAPPKKPRTLAALAELL